MRTDEVSISPQCFLLAIIFWQSSVHSYPFAMPLKDIATNLRIKRVYRQKLILVDVASCQRAITAQPVRCIACALGNSTTNACCKGHVSAILQTSSIFSVTVCHALKWASKNRSWSDANAKSSSNAKCGNKWFHIKSSILENWFPIIPEHHLKLSVRSPKSVNPISRQLKVSETLTQSI